MAFEGDELQARINALGTLVRSGYDPIASLSALGLPEIAHTGMPPVTVKGLTDEAPRAWREAA